MSDTPSPATPAFTDFSFADTIQRGIRDLGFSSPRPIQAATIPAALAGQDVLGLAQTGTGKTAAFALPILQRLQGKRGTKPRALIVAPTRELALQITAEISALARYTQLRTATIIGGVSPAKQISALRNRPDILVACPGRLLDLKEQRFADLSGIEVLVLDEADHMFDMGFLPSVRQILKALPAQRQNLLFSATMPAEVRTLANQILDNPFVAELANARPAETIEHAVFSVANDRKIPLLRVLLDEPEFRSAIVFLRTKHRAKKLAVDLERMGYRAVALQGNMSQPQRERAMKGFRSGEFDILVATDIAARGIDVAGVSHVINFDVPDTPDAYTHRIGRTGRAEQTGKAFTFVAGEDRGAIRDIERRLGAPIPRANVVGFDLGAPQDSRDAASTKPRHTPRPPHHRAGPPARDQQSRRGRGGFGKSRFGATKDGARAQAGHQGR